MFQIIFGIIKSRKVQFHAIADAVKMEGDTVKVASIEHRIEDFFREVDFDYEMIVCLLVFCLGSGGRIRLCIDRTEWDFGTYQVNILMLMACKGSKGVPLYWELLDNKSGNSNTLNRIGLLENVIALIGASRIGILVADRGFIGHGWLKYLKDKGINFCVRVPKHHKIERLDGRKQKIEDLAGTDPLYLRDCMVDGVWVGVYLKKLENGDFLYLAGTMADPRHPGDAYRKRWTIETMFQSFKTRGFDIESSHLKGAGKLKKLVGMVSIAFAFCVSLGIHQHGKVQKIKMKKHGYKAKSFCRTGIDPVKDLCRQSVEVFEKTIEKFLRFLSIQMIRYLESKINVSLPIT